MCEPPRPALEFRILGPLEVTVAGASVDVGVGKQQALLGVLALSAGEVVSVQRIIDCLWGEEPPRTAAKTLQSYVSRARKALGRTAVVTHAGGYLLDVAAQAVDAVRFERLADEASACLQTDPAGAARLLREALRLWRGDVLSGLAVHAQALDEVRRLAERRLVAREQHVEAQLALGLHGELIGELRALVAAEPYRETLRAHLMLALYRAGRQSEALACYRDTRQLLADELGLEPGPALRRLEAAILAQTAALDLSGGDALAAASRTGAAGSVPLAPTSLVGREHELRTLADTLRQGDVRMLTLTGTGGIGKTRLAIELARVMASEFRDGAHYVALAALSHPDEVVTALVERLGVRPFDDEPTLRAAERTLSARRALLVFDNFEHVLPAAPAIARLLSVCPEIVVVATSREPLKIAAERVIRVPALSLPATTELLDSRSIARSAAVELFAQRAAARDDRFCLTAHNAHAVGRICVRLGGLPLAIELAAARAALLGPQELLRRLDGALDLLTSAAGDAEPRHRTLRATIDWSFALLHADEQTALCALSVFAGGASLHAAETVAQVSLDALEALVAKSLAVRSFSADGEPRLVLLDMIGQYAQQRLADRDDADAIRRRHSEYFVALAEHGAGELWGPRQLHWLQVFDDERLNFQAAVDWSILAGAPQLGLRLAAAAMEQWGFRRRPHEVARWIRTTLDACAEIDDGLRGRALTGLALADDDSVQAAALAHQGLPFARAARDPRATCWCLRLIAVAQPPGQATAATLAAQALSVARDADDPGSLVIALDTRMFVAETLAESHPYFEESVAVLRAVGDQLNTAVVLCNVGWLAMLEGVNDFAGKALEDSIELTRRIRDPRGLSYALTNRGLLWLLQGDFGEARAVLHEALRLARDLGLHNPVRESLLGLSVIAAHGGGLEHAAQLFGAATTIRGNDPLSIPEQRLHDRHIAPLRDDPHWNENQRRGAALDRDAAIALGLEQRQQIRPRWVTAH